MIGIPDMIGFPRSDLHKRLAAARSRRPIALPAAGVT